jgi:hypothetical protein
MLTAAAECLHLAHARGLSCLHCWGRRRKRLGRLGVVLHYQSAGKAGGQMVLVNGFTHGHWCGGGGAMHWCHACEVTWGPEGAACGAVPVGACIPTHARSGKEGPCIQCCCTSNAARTLSTHTRSQRHGSQTGSALESVLITHIAGIDACAGQHRVCEQCSQHQHQLLYMTRITAAIAPHLFHRSCSGQAAT